MRAARPVVRVAGDAERALAPDLAQDVVRALIAADVALDVAARRPRARRDRLRHGAHLIGARIVDDQDFLGATRLREDGMEAGTQVARFVMGTDDDANPQRHACARGMQPRRGQFGWSGAASTRVWIAPKEDMVVVVLRQDLSYDPGFLSLAQTLAYQAIANCGCGRQLEGAVCRRASVSAHGRGRSDLDAGYLKANSSEWLPSHFNPASDKSKRAQVFSSPKK